MKWYRHVFSQSKPMALPVETPFTMERTDWETPSGARTIDRVMTEETAREQKSQHPESSFLGAGGYGLAVDLGGGMAGKYITEYDEIWTINKLLEEGGDVPGFVKIYGLNKLQEGGEELRNEPGGDLWVAVIEKVQTLDMYEKKFIETLRLYTGSSFYETYGEWISDYEHIMHDAYMADLPNISSAPDNVDTKKLYEGYRQLLSNIYAFGAVPVMVDAHGGNIGWNSKGELVLFDLSEVHEGMESYDMYMSY